MLWFALALILLYAVFSFLSGLFAGAFIADRDGALGIAIVASIVISLAVWWRWIRPRKRNWRITKADVIKKVLNIARVVTRPLEFLWGVVKGEVARQIFRLISRLVWLTLMGFLMMHWLSLKASLKILVFILEFIIIAITQSTGPTGTTLVSFRWKGKIRHFPRA